MRTEFLKLSPKEFCLVTECDGFVKDYILSYKIMSRAWDKCPRPDWLLWILEKLEYEDDKTLRLFAVWCAREMPLADGRKTLDLLTDPRSLDAIIVAERYANGLATKEELAAADKNAGLARYGLQFEQSRAAESAFWTTAFFIKPWYAARESAEAAATIGARKMQGYAYAGEILKQEMKCYAYEDALELQANKLKEMIPDPFTSN